MTVVTIPARLRVRMKGIWVTFFGCALVILVIKFGHKLESLAGLFTSLHSLLKQNAGQVFVNEIPSRGPMARLESAQKFLWYSSCRQLT